MKKGIKFIFIFLMSILFFVYLFSTFNNSSDNLLVSNQEDMALTSITTHASSDSYQDKQLAENSCLDNTPYNQCSDTKPKFCSSGILVNKCSLCGCPNQGKCLPDESCLSEPTGFQSDISDQINKAPLFSFIPQITVYEDQTDISKLIVLSDYILFPKDKKLDFTFWDKHKIFDSDMINCFINDDVLGCDPPKRAGESQLVIFASDGIKESSSTISLKVIQEGLFKTSDVVGGGYENKAPIANAGEDKFVLIRTPIVLDGSKSYDTEDNLPDLDSNYVWYENENEIGRGIRLKKMFPLGVHVITLQVIDREGLSSTDKVIISVIPKEKCRDTDAVYIPEDTICNKKWPSQEGESLLINSKAYSCDLAEVCNEDLDFIIEESLDCCDGSPLISDESKVNACNFANKYSNKNTKRCQALYLIESLGGNSIYMKDYFELEMCCKGVKELCNNENYLYSAQPKPIVGKDLSKLRCDNKPDNNPPGEWISDTKLELNKIALQDVPAHVSLNILSTGTCVDYSFALTTLLRKAGYKKDEVYTVESIDHAYNLVKLPLDKKYTIVDTTGNNNPAIIFGRSPLGYKYCENIRKCYNDNGEFACPDLKEVYGCQNVKQSIAAKANVIGLKTNKIINYISKLIKKEVER